MFSKIYHVVEKTVANLSKVFIDLLRLLHVLTTYLTLSNYTWMLCEGSYLHFLLTMPFIEADIRLQIFSFSQ